VRPPEDISSTDDPREQLISTNITLKLIGLCTTVALFTLPVAEAFARYR
jgi:hypothetical protein